MVGIGRRGMLPAAGSVRGFGASREPEGIGVHLRAPSDPNGAFLYFGPFFGSAGARKATPYTKPA